ncbi:MAG TPA: serine hydroxymethyltransferase [Planctomycetota bacterium]|jgi:glycine hydroxymethyltransferase|nr:serine hydroxymethyltransferase [Planctomycetota bacterium]
MGAPSSEAWDPLGALARLDPEVHDALAAEWRREEEGLELIASENHVGPAVLAATGSLLTNKYAEGYPGARYYGGCGPADRVETLARERARALFGGDHANVQPHSGTQANMGALLAIAEPGDTVLSLNLAHGGHLSHGHPKNFTGRFFRVVHYGVSSRTETIDYAELRRLAEETKPRVLLAGASAYPRRLDFGAFADIARACGARLMVDMAHIAGLVAAGVHENPVPVSDAVTFTTHKTLRGPRGGAVICREEFAKKLDSAVFPGIQGGPLMHVIAAKAVAFREAAGEPFRRYQAAVLRNAAVLAASLAERGHRIVTGGTDTHLFLVDLRPAGMTGREAEDALGSVGITVNKNLIPFDERSPRETSGLRLGSPAVTTRGMRDAEMVEIAGLVDARLRRRDEEETLREVGGKVRDLCRRFPVYAGYGAALERAGRERLPGA